MAIAVQATRTALAAAYVALGAYISLHTADPGTTGTNEATGGSPAYARKQTTWSGSTDTRTGSEVTIDVAAGTYTYAGIWSAATSGTFVDKIAITSTTLSAQGQIKVTPSYVQS